MRYFHGSSIVGLKNFKVDGDDHPFGPAVYLSDSERTAELYAKSKGSVYEMEVDVPNEKIIDLNLMLGENDDIAIRAISRVALDLKNAIRRKYEDHVNQAKKTNLMLSALRVLVPFKVPPMPEKLEKVVESLNDIGILSQNTLGRNARFVLEQLGQFSVVNRDGNFPSYPNKKAINEALAQHGITMLQGYLDGAEGGGRRDDGMQYAVLKPSDITLIAERRVNFNSEMDSQPACKTKKLRP